MEVNSTRSLDALRAEFRAPVDLWLADLERAGMVALITATYRSPADQDALYAIGRTAPGKKCIPVIRPMGLKVTNARAFESPHQFSAALDFVPMDCAKPDWSGKGKLWDAAIMLAEKRGLKSLRPMESAHLELPGWRTLVGVK